jgi:hypothetical protein
VAKSITVMKNIGEVVINDASQHCNVAIKPQTTQPKPFYTV